MSADAVDDDTEAAILSLWQLDAGGLMQLFKQLPRTGRLKSIAPGADVQATGPYAVLDSTLARKELVAADAKSIFGWNDYRNITVTIYGLRADIVAAVKLFLALFNRKTGVPGLGAPFVYPSAARFIRWWPIGDAKIEEDKDSKAGKDVWKATCRAEVWSVREEPAPSVTVVAPAVEAPPAIGTSGQFGDLD